MVEITEGMWYKTAAFISLILVLCSAEGTRCIFRYLFFISGAMQREKILTSEAVGFSVISNHNAAALLVTL